MKRFIEGLDRGQATLFPERFEDYIDDDNPENKAAMTAPWLAPGQMEVYRLHEDR